MGFSTLECGPLGGDSHGVIWEEEPGQQITGRVGWQLDDAPKKAALRLFWYTEGRGTQDVGIVEEREFHSLGLSHEENFSFRLPNEPYSFSGKLISLRWALELVLNKGKEVKRIDLMVSPWVEQVTLGTVESDDGLIKKFFGDNVNDENLS